MRQILRLRPTISTTAYQDFAAYHVSAACHVSAAY